MTSKWMSRTVAARHVARVAVVGPTVGAALAGVLVGVAGPGPWMVRAALAAVAALALERALTGLTRWIEPWLSLLPLGLGADGVALPSRLQVARAMARPARVEEARAALAADGLGRDPSHAMYQALVAVLGDDVDRRTVRTRAQHAHRLAEAAGVDRPDTVALVAVLADIGEFVTSGEHHATAGARALGTLGDPFEPIARAVSHHHAHWDGSGTPLRLSGDRIDPTARLVAAAEVLARASAEGLDPADALEAACGHQVDPSILALVDRTVAATTPRRLMAALPGMVAAVVAPGVAAAATVTAALTSPAQPVEERAQSAAVNLPADSATLPTRDQLAADADSPAVGSHDDGGIERAVREVFRSAAVVTTTTTAPAPTTTTSTTAPPPLVPAFPTVPVPTTRSPEVSAVAAPSTEAPTTTAAPETTTTTVATTTTAPTTTTTTIVIWVPPSPSPTTAPTTTTRRSTTTTTRKPSTTTTRKPSTTTTRPTTTTAAPTTTTAAPTTTAPPTTTSPEVTTTSSSGIQ